MATTKLLLATGIELEVDGSVEDASKALENAARSSMGTLAWLTDATTQSQLGVNPAHVVTVTPGEE